MSGYIYIIGNQKPILYIGVTNNLKKRVWEHKQELVDGFSKKYHLHKLLYYEQLDTIKDAINREKQLKNWRRKWKLELIKSQNPEFKDLYSEIE